MVRPLESFDQHLLQASLEISPEPSSLRWLQDVFGNAVAVAEFEQQASDLKVESKIQVLHAPFDPEEIHVERYARRYPFTYSTEDMPDLLRSIERSHHDVGRTVDSWARTFVGRKGAKGTLRMLRRMTDLIHDEFACLAHDEGGPQTPTETLVRRRGTCRDFAVLLMDAARALGLAARFVHGYRYDPAHREPLAGGGNAHAWVRVFLPGSGWIELDPTSGIVGSRGLIRVAVARDPRQAVPIDGTWRSSPSDDPEVSVTVDVHCQDMETAPTLSRSEESKNVTRKGGSEAPAERAAADEKGELDAP